jgi:antitoxin (DNA-binding transcriptional repressor) of toxin-antitoxin stability system
MALKQISVTEAARNFSELISRVHYRGEETLLLKGGKPMVRVVPASRPKSGRVLAALWLKRPALGAEEASNLERDLDEARRRLGPLVSPWE